MEADELVRRREALKLTRMQLAREVDVNVATIWRWETGKFKPSGLALRQLERTLRRLERATPGQGAGGG